MNNHQNSYQKLLVGLSVRRAPESLYRAVLLRLSVEQKHAEKRRFFVASVSFLVSISAAVPAVLVLASSLAASGFWKFISLIFSDSGTVVTLWQQFSMSLLESFSVPEVVVALVCIFAVLLSVKFLMKSQKTFLTSQLQFV